MVGRLDHKDLSLLIKLCGMLGSASDGERSNAALKATELLRRSKLTWQEFFAQLTHAAYMSAPKTEVMPQHTDKPPRRVYQPRSQRATHEQWVAWTAIIAECRKRPHRLTPWDQENLSGMEAKLGLGLALTHTQQQRLVKLRSKLHRYHRATM